MAKLNNEFGQVQKEEESSVWASSLEIRVSATKDQNVLNCSFCTGRLNLKIYTGWCHFTLQHKTLWFFWKKKKNIVRGMGSKSVPLFLKYINKNICYVMYIMPILYPSYSVPSLGSHTKLRGTHNQSKLKTHEGCKLKSLYSTLFYKLNPKYYVQNFTAPGFSTWTESYHQNGNFILLR